MGAIRKILLVIVAVLFFLSLILVSLFLTLNLSLKYDNIQQHSTTIIKDVLNENFNLTTLIGNNYQLLQQYCMQGNSNYTINTQGYNLVIPCSSVSQGADAVIDTGIKALVNQTYYAQYNCGFLDCFPKYPVPLFLISEKAYNFWNGMFYLALGFAVILLLLLFFLMKKKINLPTLAGILLIFSSIPFFKLEALMSLFSNKLIFKFLGIFFSQAYFVAITILIAGIALLTVGIVLDIFRTGFFVEHFITKIEDKRKSRKSK